MQHVKPTTITQSLRAELELARAGTDALFELLDPEALYDRPIPERHRNIFYLGHLEAFDWNLIASHTGTPRFHPEFDRLFAFGIDPDPGELPRDQPHDWPHVEEVREYNARVRQSLDTVLDRAPEQLLHVAIEHRLMHAETFAYMLNNMPYERKTTVPVAPASSGLPPETRFVEAPAGTALLGAAPHQGFGWDNEFEAHEVRVAAFAIGKHKVTNGDFLRFVTAGAAPPPFWKCSNGEWMYRGMFGGIPLPLDWPVYCSHREASDYAAWAGGRLPTEAEFHRAAWGDGDGAWQPDPDSDNFDFRRWDPVPVTASRENPFGLAQLVGNGWEWTATPFQPFPGFAPFPFYRGYSANFFDGRHIVLKGASPRTAARLARPSFRNWFRADYPYVYATFRLVEGQ